MTDFMEFSSTILSWRLSMTGTALEEAQSAAAIPATFPTSPHLYASFVPYILEEARAAVKDGLDLETDFSFVHVRDPPHSDRQNKKISHLRVHGKLGTKQEHSPYMNVIKLTSSYNQHTVNLKPNHNSP